MRRKEERRKGKEGKKRQKKEEVRLVGKGNHWSGRKEFSSRKIEMEKA